MSPRLLGKVALITGASRGIGRATALAIAREGASVIVNYAGNVAAAKEVVTEIEGLGRRAIAVQADVGNPADIKQLIDHAVAAFERVDILVCNAGLLMMKDLASTTSEDFDKMFGVNVKGPYFLAQGVQKCMPDGGRIIFFSTSLTTASSISPNYLLYASTKGAVEQMTRVMAKDLGRRSITVNTVSPGPTATELFYEGKSEQTVKMIEAWAPANRLGKPEEVADSVLFLTSPEAAWVNGQNLRVNGGMA